MDIELQTNQKKKEKISLSSKKKWFWLAIAITLISPISGVILAIAFLTESELKNQGKIILPFSIIWGVVFIFLTNWMVERGYLPF